MIKVLITTWGNPWRAYSSHGGASYRWDMVKYRFELDDQVYTLESRTTLPLIHSVIRPDKTMVIVQDTVVYRVLDLSLIHI